VGFSERKGGEKLSSIIKIVRAAEELGREHQLPNPTNDDILIYAAELAEDTTTDLQKLPVYQVRAILNAYERGERS